MNIALWIAQGLLALAFAMAGGMKLTQPKDKLAPRMTFVEDYSANAVKAIGAVEVLGALGVVLPWLTGVLPFLTTWAAAGLGLTMVGAIITHVRRNELPGIVPNVVLLALSAFVAYGRSV